MRILGEMGFVISRNTALPARHTDIFLTIEDDQTEIIFKVFQVNVSSSPINFSYVNFILIQGENPRTEFNTLLGEFSLVDIPKGPAEKEKIDVTFTVDVNGILKVTATIRSTRKEAKIIVDSKINMSKTEIGRLTENAKRQKEIEMELKALKNCKNNLEQVGIRKYNKILILIYFQYFLVLLEHEDCILG